MAEIYVLPYAAITAVQCSIRGWAKCIDFSFKYRHLGVKYVSIDINNICRDYS